ncbi:MAG TPA: hypothetical protein VGA56_16685 [Opitutaceae bacterium]
MIASLRESFFLRQQFEHLTFIRTEEQFAGQPGNFAAEQHEQHDAPGDDRVQGDGSQEGLGAIVLMRFNLADSARLN